MKRQSKVKTDPEIKKQIITIVSGYFDGDLNKASLWFFIKNPMWGGVSPHNMIEAGYEKQVLLDVKRMVAENNKAPFGA